MWTDGRKCGLTVGSVDKRQGTVEKCGQTEGDDREMCFRLSAQFSVRVSNCQHSVVYVFQTVSTMWCTCFRLSAQCRVRVSDCQHSVVHVFQTVSTVLCTCFRLSARRVEGVRRSLRRQTYGVAMREIRGSSLLHLCTRFSDTEVLISRLAVIRNIALCT